MSGVLPRDENHVTAIGFESSTTPGLILPGQINEATGRILTSMAGGGSGTVQSISIATANGFAGTSDGDPSTPALTLSTSITGILKGNGTAISAVTIGSGLSYDGTTLSATGGGGGNVSNTGTPVNNQIAVWTDATTIEGDADLTWSGTQLAIAGSQTITVADTSNVTGLTINQNDSTNDPLALVINGPAAGAAAKVTSATLVQYNDETGSNSDWSFNVAGNSYPAINLQATGGTLAAPTQFGGTTLGGFYQRSYNSTPASYPAGGFEFVASDTTAGSMDTLLQFSLQQAGTYRNVLTLNDGINGISVGGSHASGVVESNGNNDLILQTGNATTGSITIADGANGDITLDPNGDGVVRVNGSFVNVTDGTRTLVTNLDNTFDYTEIIGTNSDGSQFYLLADTGATYLTLRDKDSSTTGPYIDLYHDSASPAASDVVGELRFSGEDSGGGKDTYARIKGVITDPTAASEDGKLVFNTMTAGTAADELELTGAALYPTTNDGLALGSATLAYSDLFLAEGGVINWDNGDATITQSGNTITVAGITAFDTGTSTALTAGTIELGAATDTTISRVSAGVIAVEGNNVILANTTATRSMVLTASGGNPTTTSGCASPTKVEAGTNDVDYFVLDFDASTVEYAFWNVVLPDNYNGGTVTATFYWTAAAGAAGNVVWALQGRAYADDAAIDQAWGTAQEVTDAWIANGDVHISSATAAITLGGSPAGGQYAAFRAYRNATSGSDTMTGDARLLSIKVEYTINAYSE